MTKELDDLRKAFPGIWVREDGAIRNHGTLAIGWEPGDVEADPMLVREERRGGLIQSNCGLIRIGGDYSEGAMLKLSQLKAIVAYVEAQTRAIAALEPAPDLSDAQKQQIDAANAEYATGQAVAVGIPEGFTAWEGLFIPPVRPGTRVVVICNDGTELEHRVVNNDDWSTVIAYRILQAHETPASEQDASGQGEPQTDAGSAPEATQGAATTYPAPELPGDFLYNGADLRQIARNMGALDGLTLQAGQPIYLAPDDTTFNEEWARANEPEDAPILTPEPQTYTTETGLTLSAPIAAGDALPDPSTHIEHDGTGYWTGTVDGETP